MDGSCKYDNHLKVIPATSPERTTPRRIEAEYDYVDESGSLLIQVVRSEEREGVGSTPGAEAGELSIPPRIA
jgi:hypothetical protein